MDLGTVFQRLGCGKNVGRVYETLLDARTPMLVSHVRDASGIERPEVYRSLSSLLERGFIEKSALGKRTAYKAGDPRKIHTAFRKDADRVRGLAKALAEERESALPAHVLYFTGPSGIRAVFDDAVDRTPRGETFYRYTSERDLDAVNRYLSPDYRARRDKKKLERLVISNPVSGKKKKSRLERFVKFIPPEADLFDHNAIQLVYADSIAFINLTTEEAYIIRDSDLARFQSVIFKQLYRRL